ncbi:MAG: DUF3232 domain-containing protein [Nanoarchaeota archaeon]
MTLEATAEMYFRRNPRVLDDRLHSESCKEAYNRFMQLRDFLERQTDNKGLDLLTELVDKAAGYVESIVCASLFRTYLEVERMIHELKERDQRRRIAHEALIAQLHATNRYLFQTYGIGKDIPAGGVFSLTPEAIKNRTQVGDWAGYLVLGLYERRKRS